MALGATGDRIVTAIRRHLIGIVLVVVGLFLLLDLARQLTAGSLLVADILTFVWNGTVLGMAVGLAGIGLAMTYSILQFPNFAHGDLMTGGALAGWIVAFLVAGFGAFPIQALLHLGGPFTINLSELGVSVTSAPLALLAGLVVAALFTAWLALATDRLVFRPMREESGIALLIASIGVALALRYLYIFTLQSGRRGLTAGQKTPSFDLVFGGGTLPINAHEVTLIVLAAGLMLGTHILLRYTKLGTAMRAMADNEDLARVTGIPTERVVRATWILGGGLTGAAGYLVALEQGTITMTLGWTLLLLIFAAVILGGIGSVYGAMLGGLVIGLASRLSLIWLPSSFIEVAAFLVMITILLVRPAGILSGVRTA